MDGRRPRVLLGATGSVASIKVAALCRLLLEFADVKLVLTASAKNFINEAELPAEVKPVLGDEAEWRQWRSVGDPVLHIELRRWADCLLVAPLSANSLAKMANGIADNLLTCVVRAWDLAAKPLLVAPAMNTAMWSSPFTSRHIDTLAQIGGAHFVVIPPVSKRLACGDEGTGAMAAPEDIAAWCRRVVLWSGSGSGSEPGGAPPTARTPAGAPLGSAPAAAPDTGTVAGAGAEAAGAHAEEAMGGAGAA